MKKIFALAICMFAGNAYAQESSITLQLPAVSYSVSDTEGYKESAVNTAARSYAWMSISHDDYLLYYYPFGTLPMLSASRLFGGKYELGVDFGSNALSNNDKSGSANIYGAFAGVFPTLGYGWGSEFYLVGDRFQALGDEIPNTVVTGSLYKVSADFTYALNKRLTYVGGVNYSAFDQDGLLTQTFGVNIMSLRLSF